MQSKLCNDGTKRGRIKRIQGRRFHRPASSVLPDWLLDLDHQSPSFVVLALGTSWMCHWCCFLLLILQQIYCAMWPRQMFFFFYLTWSFVEVDKIL